MCREGVSKYVVVALLLVPAGRLCAADADPNDIKTNNFSFIARMHYDSALANGVKNVNVMVAAKMGRTERAIQAFTALQGKAVERYDAVGYFWGNIPTDQLPKLLTVPDIDEFQLDGERGSLLEYYEPTDPNSLAPGSLWKRATKTPPNPDLAHLPELRASQLEGTNPYLPWYLVGVPDLLKQHPTFDGRGTTVAVVGYSVGDLLHPAMQDALTLDGKPIPKVAGILEVPRAENDIYAVRLVAEEPPSLPPPFLELRMTDPIQSETKNAGYEGATFTLPEPGAYRIGRLVHDQRSFPVLWSPSKASVWVDTNQNGSFADEIELKDINRQFSAARFPAEKGDPDKPLALPVSFGITIDQADSRIRFFLSDQAGDASVIAGKGFLGGKGNGVAPGARILYVPIGSPYQLTSYHQNLKAYLLVAQRPDVDVIEGGDYIVNPPIGGQTVTSLILDRIALVYQKPMFFIEGDMGSGKNVFGIRDYMSAGDWRKLYGVNAPLQDNVSQGGPEGGLDGEAKPDLLLPDAIYATSCDLPDGSSGAYFNYRVPPCYRQTGSQSKPVAAAAGLAAVLISAAKQSRVPYNLDRIAWALRSGARYLDQMGTDPVGHQGYGMPDIARSWSLMASAEPTPSFTISSVSNGRMENYSRAPHQGTGINEFLGVHAGSSGMREVTITRNSGAAGNTRYRLAWRGNDGTFTAPVDVELPLGTPIAIRIAYAPKSMGIHQAILQIVDPASNLPLHGFMNTVVASTPLGSGNTALTWKAEGKGIPLSHEACSLVDVQPDVAAIDFHMSLPSGAAITQIFSSPLLGPEWYLRRTADAPESHATVFDDDDEARYALFSHPPPGPWAFCVANSQSPGRIQKKTTASYIEPEIKLNALTADVKLESVQTGTSSSGAETFTGKVHVQNEGGALKKAALHVRLGYQERHAVTIGPPGTTVEVDADVADGVQVLLFRIQGADKADGLGAVIYNCGDFASDPKIFRPPKCRFQDFRENPSTIEYRVPHEGKWKLFLYRLLGGNDDLPLNVDVIQIPAGDAQTRIEKVPNADDVVGQGLDARRELERKAAPVKIQGVQTVGAVNANAAVDEAVHVDLMQKKAPGVPVAVTELYDLGAEENASEFAARMYPFDPTHSRPIALGLDIEPLPVKAP